MMKATEQAPVYCIEDTYNGAYACKYDDVLKVLRLIDVIIYSGAHVFGDSRIP